MGMYDQQIRDLRRRISQAQNQIAKRQQEIRELKALSDKSKKGDKQIEDTLNTIYAGIRKRSQGLSQEFAERYLAHIKELANKNHLNNLSETTQLSDRSINDKIGQKENEIRTLRGRIRGWEQEISGYQASEAAQNKEGAKQG